MQFWWATFDIFRHLPYQIEFRLLLYHYSADISSFCEFLLPKPTNLHSFNIIWVLMRVSDEYGQVIIARCLKLLTSLHISPGISHNLILTIHFKCHHCSQPKASISAHATFISATIRHVGRNGIAHHSKLPIWSHPLIRPLADEGKYIIFKPLLEWEAYN